LEADTAPLSQKEKDALLRLPVTIKEIGPDRDIVREGDKPSQCCVVLEGFQCRYKMLRDGERANHVVPYPRRHS
jgi:CRP-like cAMP-binding protein